MIKSETSGKIIGAGFQKTGTTSLKEALEQLGYKVGNNNHQLLFPILHGNFNRVIKKLNQYDAVEDNPWPLVYKEIDQKVPGCKFILTIRDEESWYESVKRHIGKLENPMHEWIYGRNKGIPADDKANTIAIYRNHNEEVRRYFKNRPDDLLEIDLTRGEGWDKLCSFLNKEIPNQAFPHANNRKASESSKPSTFRSARLKKKQIKYWLQIAYLRYRGFI